MGYCWRENCLGDGDLRCSGCKTATYCNTTCKKAHWRVHKKECKMQRVLYDMEQQEAQDGLSSSGQKPRKTHCTGCNQKFTPDDVEVDQECPDCGYLTCESCSCSNSRGSCYCDDSNFGNAYCSQEPRFSHCGKQGMYKGDYHPSKEEYDLNPEDVPEAFESKKRPCNRCGNVVFCLKKSYI